MASSWFDINLIFFFSHDIYQYAAHMTSSHQMIHTIHWSPTYSNPIHPGPFSAPGSYNHTPHRDRFEKFTGELVQEFYPTPPVATHHTCNPPTHSLPLWVCIVHSLVHMHTYSILGYLCRVRVIFGTSGKYEAQLAMEYFLWQPDYFVIFSCGGFCNLFAEGILMINTLA